MVIWIIWKYKYEKKIMEKYKYDGLNDEEYINVI